MTNLDRRIACLEHGANGMERLVVYRRVFGTDGAECEPTGIQKSLHLPAVDRLAGETRADFYSRVHAMAAHLPRDLVLSLKLCGTQACKPQDAASI